MSRPDTEILVHIAARSRAADDTRYRTLAAAYLDFEPTRQTPIITFELEAARASEKLSHAETEGFERPPQEEEMPQSTPAFPVIESPMLSFRSVVNNLASPQLQGGGKGNIQTESQLSWRAPPSVVQDSMPDNHMAFAQFCTPTRILEHYTSTFDSSQPVSSPSQRREPGTSPTSNLCRKRDGSTEVEQHPQQSHDEAGGIIPHSPPAATKPPPRPTITASAIIEETRIASSYASQKDPPPTLARADSAPPAPKRPKLSSSSTHEPGKPLSRSASDIGPRARPHPPSDTSLPATLSILSPPPPTTQRTLLESDLITPILARLASTLELPKRFTPSFQARPLRPFERGYWRLDCSGWEPELKRSAWVFLSDYLGKGAAGWGTSCKRDEGFTWVRVYCWGCVVGHMYLVVYLASERRVLRTGAEWVAGDGEAVVVMGAREARGEKGEGGG